MKAIRNYDSLIQRIKNEDSNWQKIIYDATGAILLKDCICSVVVDIFHWTRMQSTYIHQEQIRLNTLK